MSQHPCALSHVLICQVLVCIRFYVTTFEHARQWVFPVGLTTRCTFSLERGTFFVILYTVLVSFLFWATHGIMSFSVLTVLHRNKPVQATWAFCSLYQCTHDGTVKSLVLIIVALSQVPWLPLWASSWIRFLKRWPKRVANSHWSQDRGQLWTARENSIANFFCWEAVTPSRPNYKHLKFW